ncbi:carbohydrate ABC transporter permease [Pseudothermotoga thermarum]|nr:sugar ABC transporter permease [Pseudothermotoga thermarum]
MNNPRFIGFQNYVSVLNDPWFLTYVLNTIVWIGFSVLFQFVFGLILALLLNKPFFGRSVYMGLVFYPWSLSGFVIGLLWSWLLNGQFGVLNDILLKIGIIRSSVSFLSDPKLAMFSVIMVNVWYGIPFFAIMLLAALQAIPQELYEAAAIDGAGLWKQFLTITLPSLKPTIVNSVLLRIIWVMNFPDIIYGMTRGGPAGVTTTLSVYMINIVYYRNDFGKAAAVGVIITLILLSFTVLYLALLGRDE